MKKILLLLAILHLTSQLISQVPNNVTKPYSVTNNINIEKNTINLLSFDRPTVKIEKIKDKDIYAVDIEINIDVIKESTKIKLSNEKTLTVLKLKAVEAKSINLSFSNFYLNQNSKMFIYSPDKKQIMGPITNINNNSTFSTHLIFSNNVIIEVVSDSNTKNTILLKNIAYGVKNINYFDDLIKDSEEEYNYLSIQTSTCHPDIDTLERNCHFVGEMSPLDTFKQINCNQFDILEKVKRSLCVVITKDSLDTGWTAKGGVLINTVENGNNNYCNSYILTCSHCISNNPKYFAIRFNWLRENCEIPNGIVNCYVDNQPWIDLIKMNEVVDYCDVEMVNRESLGAGIEYAFLKINEPLRFKEYFSGWKIYEERPKYTLDSCYIAGPWGGNPFEANQRSVDVLQYIGMLDHSPNLVSGHSGTMVFDKKANLIGVNNRINQAISLSLLYYNGAWSPPRPRDILDLNGFYATNFSNKDSIVVEGVERYEKSDCLYSTLQCNPT